MGLDFKIRVVSSPNQVISWSHWVAVRSFGTRKTPLEFHFIARSGFTDISGIKVIRN